MIKVIRDFLDPADYQSAADLAYHSYFSHDTAMKTNATWPAAIVKDSAPVLVWTMDQTTELYSRIRARLVDRFDIEPTAVINIMFYYWTRHSYIPWHNDAHVDMAVTIYLNPQWHLDFGGLFLWQDQTGIHAHMPEANMAIGQKDVFHSTTPVNWDGGVRSTLQIFVKNTPADQG
jgi:hypothetical protein